jgi:hypothetical protein
MVNRKQPDEIPNDQPGSAKKRKQDKRELP